MRISGTTTLLGLISTPVEHSKSPAMYNHCFQKFGLDWAYLAFDIPRRRRGTPSRPSAPWGCGAPTSPCPAKTPSSPTSIS